MKQKAQINPGLSSQLDENRGSRQTQAPESVDIAHHRAVALDPLENGIRRKRTPSLPSVAAESYAPLKITCNFCALRESRIDAFGGAVDGPCRGWQIRKFVACPGISAELPLGSGLNQSHQVIAAAMKMVAAKFVASLSYRVAMRRQSLSRQNIRSIALRTL
jgi:hypothetical protein